MLSCAVCKQQAEVWFRAEKTVPLCFGHLLKTCDESCEFRVMTIRESDEGMYISHPAKETTSEQLVESLASVENYVYSLYVQPEPAVFPDYSKLDLCDSSHFPHKSDIQNSSLDASRKFHAFFQDHCSQLITAQMHSKELETSVQLFPNTALEVIPVPNFNCIKVGEGNLCAKKAIGRLVSVRTGIQVYKMLRSLYAASAHMDFTLEVVKSASAYAFQQYQSFDTQEFIYIHRDTSRPLTISRLICVPLQDLWEAAFSHLGETNPELTLISLIFILISLLSDTQESSKEAVQRILPNYEEKVNTMRKESLVPGGFWLLGLCWSALDSFSQAETCFRKALESLKGRISRKGWGKDYGQVAIVLQSLGALYNHTEKYTQASICYDRALGIYVSFSSSRYIHPASNAFFRLRKLYSRLSEKDLRIKVTISVLEKHKTWFTVPELRKIYISLAEDLLLESRSRSLDSRNVTSTEASVDDGVKLASALHEQGKVLKYKKRNKEAGVYLSAAVDLLMDSEYSSGLAAEMWNDLSVANLEIGRLEDSEDGFNFAIGFLANPDDSHSDLLISICVNLGHLYSLQEKNQDCKNVYRNAEALALEVCPKSITLAQIHYQLGISYRRLGSLESATEQFKFAIEIHQLTKPGSSEEALDHCGLGAIYEEMKIWEKAQKAYVEAEEIYKKLHPHGKELASVWNKLGTVCTRENRLEDAICYYKQAVQVLEYCSEGNIEQAAVLNNLGLTYARVKNYTCAVEYYQQSIALYASSYHVIVPFLRLGEVYTATNQLKEAESSFKKVAELLENGTNANDFEANAYVTIGKFYKRLKRLSDSEVNLQKAVVLYEKLDQNSETCAKARIDLGLLLFQMYKNGEAEYHLSKALDTLNKTDTDSDQVALVSSYLGDVYKAEKNLLGAESAYARAIKRFKVTAPSAERTGRLYGQIAWVYKELALYEQAEFAFTRAIEILESSPNPKATLPIYNNLGQLYKAQGRLEEAKKVFKRGVELLDSEAPGELGVSLLRNLTRLTQVGVKNGETENIQG